MKNAVFALFAFLAVFVLLAAKCNKEDPPKAVVTVIDEQGKPVAGAHVKVYSDPSYYNNGVGYPSVGYYNPDEKKLYDEQISDGSGKTTHEFKYESIYSVIVWYRKKISYTQYDTLWGEGALILKNDATYEETVTIR